MRQHVSKERIQDFMKSLGAAVRGSGTVFFTGGVTAVMLGWRDMTIDIDFKAEPEPAGFYEALPPLKDRLDINLEPACPSDFIPTLPGWRDRCLFIARHGSIDFYHYDLYSQALAKIERAHDRDRHDVSHMIKTGLLDKQRLSAFFESIRPQLIRYPAIDPESFERHLADTLA